MDIVVLGAGESGVGAAILAKQKGLKVFVSDKSSIKEKYKIELKDWDISYEENKHTEKTIFEAKEIIKSPGIPDNMDLIKALRTTGVPVISEIEFAARYTDATIIGITGSNGKTTTTNLIFHLLKTAGYNAGICGNVGISFARLVATEKRDYWVLELSSFQLDGIYNFKADIAILLNITADHLDRYDYKLENYILSKLRITKNQTEKDLLIYNNDDGNIAAYLKKLDITKQNIAVKNVFEHREAVIIDQHKFEINTRSLKGDHNLFNSSCAIYAVQHLGVKPTQIQQGIDSFVNAAHRLEWVRQIDEVDFINDSKATNIDSVYYALKAMTQDVVWVAGGIDKGNDYKVLMDLVEDKVKALICLGLDNTKLVESFSPLIKNIEETQDVTEAVKLAQLYAEKGDVVLLSPACSSFDLFKNYIDRGEQFKAAVLHL